jgi:hypothetical protein
MSIGENSGAEAGAPTFSVSMCLGPPPPFLEVTGDLDKEDRRVGGRGYDLGAEFTGCGGGIDERPREEGFLASLSPLIFGKTEVTRELKLARRPSRTPPSLTPVWWERAVHREGRAAV